MASNVEVKHVQYPSSDPESPVNSWQVLVDGQLDSEFPDQEQAERVAALRRRQGAKRSPAKAAKTTGGGTERDR